MSMNIGFIGLGNMGLPIARRLIEAGNRLTVYDTRGAAIDRAVALGATSASSVRDVADRLETVMVSLPSPEVVLAVATADDGVAGGKRVRRFVDLSTTGPRMAQRVAEALAARDIVQIDCPVSGGVGGAEKGTLAVMVAGPPVECDMLRPVFEVIGKVFYIGERPGMGQTMKLCNNLLSATAMAITSEAMVMGVKAGLDPRVMLDVINAGSGRNSASQDKFPRAILPRSFDYGFATGLMYKDLRLCLDEAEALGAQMWVAAAVRQVWQFANAQLGPDTDFTRIVQCMEGWAGVEVRARANRPVSEAAEDE